MTAQALPSIQHPTQRPTSTLELPPRAQQEVNAAQATELRLANALIASGGDLNLVTEILNKKRPNPSQTPEITQTEVLEAFLHQVNASIEAQSSIKGMILLNLLQMLSAAKDQLLGAMPDFSSGDLLRLIQLIIEGVGQMLPSPSSNPNSASNQTNNFMQLVQQFGGDTSRDRVSQRLEVYRNLEKAGYDLNTGLPLAKSPDDPDFDASTGEFGPEAADIRLLEPQND